MQQLETRIVALPDLVLTGNAYYGVGLPNLIEHGQKVARALLSGGAAHAEQR